MGGTLSSSSVAADRQAALPVPRAASRPAKRQRRPEQHPTKGPARRSSLKRAAPAGSASRRATLRALVCRRRARGVTFRSRVRVVEYSRQLDGGGTVPQDSCKVALGLGTPLRSLLVPLAEAPLPGRPPIEERAWVPGPLRERLLRRAMGTPRFIKAWLRHRREVLQIWRSRREAREDAKHRYFLLSPGEARATAQRLHEEALAFNAEELQAVGGRARSRSPRRRRRPSGQRSSAGASSSSSGGLGVAASGSSSSSSSSGPSSRRRSPTPCGGGGGRHHGAPAGTQKCHRCDRPIAFGPLAQRCGCLAPPSKVYAAATCGTWALP